MSRQMACQMSGAQVMEWAQKFVTLAAGKEEKYPSCGALLDAEIPDAKDRVKMGTAFVVLHELSAENLTAHDVLQVIRWRNEKGDPGPIEIQYNRGGREKRSLKIAEERKVQDLRTALKMFGPSIFFR